MSYPEYIVAVRRRTAFNPQRNRMMVCGNSDYTIKFDFDEEWSDLNVKTARFIYNGKFVDVVFEGDTVNVPVLKNTDSLAVGVFAGNVRTTTPAVFPVMKSITSDDGVPDVPTPDVYNQIINLIEHSGVKPEVINQMIQEYLEQHPVHVDETDPTVPAWAKQPTKPTYTASEVHALPEDTVIPAPYDDTALKEEVAGKQDKMFDFYTVQVDETDDGYSWTGEFDINKTNVVVNYFGLHLVGYVINPDPEQVIIACPTWNGEAIFYLFPDGSAEVLEENFLDRSEFVENRIEVENQLSKKLSEASEANLKGRNILYGIGCHQLDLAVKTAMCDGVGTEWTDEEKQSAQVRLGIRSIEGVNV